MAAAEQQPPAADGGKALSALLGGIAQAAYYGKADITEELLRGQLYPEAAPEEFRALRAKMGGLLQERCSSPLRILWPPLDPFQQLHIFLMLETPDLGAVLQMELHRNRAEGDSPLHVPAATVLLMHTRIQFVFWVMKALLPHVQLFIHQDPRPPPDCSQGVLLLMYT